MSITGTSRTVVTALCVSVGVAVAKLTAMLESSTSSSLASTVHSLIDTSCLGLLFLGTWHVKAGTGTLPIRRPDSVLYFWSFVVAILLYAMGGGIALFGGVERLARPQPLVAPAKDLLILAVAAAAGALIALMAMRELRLSRPPIDLPQAAVCRPSAAPTLTVLVISAATIAGNALVLMGQLTAANGGDQRSDPFSAIAVGLVMSGVAAFMAIEVKKLLAAVPASEGAAGSIPEHSQPDNGPLAVAVATAMPVLETKSLPASPETDASRSPTREGPASNKSPQATSSSGPNQKPAVSMRHAGPKGRGKRRR